VKVCWFLASLAPLVRASRDICGTAGTTSIALSRDATPDSISVTLMLSRSQPTERPEADNSKKP
jgi:hypothetical protein